jgi:glycosyltransferase involved in cell wall biosynthesis
MKYSIVIPTNRTDGTIAGLLWSLAVQTLAPTEIVIVADIRFADAQDEKDYHEYVGRFLTGHKHRIVTQESDTDFAVGKGASYVRNYGIAQTTTTYVLCIDDDNVLDEDMMEQLRATYTSIELDTKQGVVIPSEKYRLTDTIRSQWYSRFRYRLGWVTPEAPVTQQQYKKIQFASSNCIFGPREVFVTYPLDEQMPFVYEDMDRTMRMARAGHPLYALTNVYTSHMMRDKTPLEDSYLATTQSAYYKAKHRIMRVRKTANGRQKAQYLLLGLHLHTAWLLYKVARYAPAQQQLGLAWAIVRGTIAGLTTTAQSRNLSHQ